MYGGRGTQYRMGPGLYAPTRSARPWDRCSAQYERRGTSLVAAMTTRPARPGLRRRPAPHTPALYSVGWSLTEALRAEGFRPDAVSATTSASTSRRHPSPGAMC
ncbi:hypothetical protein LV779_34325 [Streptomyces thinghirensis]|nr:hypothetical protein [Streptomyces thinghirensis]